METIVVSGGGTGGHFFPAISFINILNKCNIKSIYIGSKNGIESRLTNQIPTDYTLLDTKGFVGKSLKAKISSIYNILKATKELNSNIDNDFKSVVFGGYVSLPLGFLSFLKKKNLFIHEQNTIPSLTNRVLSKKAKICFTTFNYTSKFFKDAIRVGIPIREGFLMDFDKKELQKELNIKSPCILVMGGSQGAKALNDVALELFNKTNYQGIIITGEKNHDEISKKAKYLSNIKTIPFTNNMHKLMRVCDVAISRSGASTIYELALSGLPSIFVPYPYAAYNHQYFNAKEIEELGGAITINQDELSIELLLKALDKILEGKEVFSKSIKNFVIKDEKGDIILPQEYMLKFIEGVL